MLGRLEKFDFPLLVLQALESLLQQGLSLEEALREVGRRGEGGSSEREDRGRLEGGGGAGEDRGRQEGALQRGLREAMDAGGMTQDQVSIQLCLFRLISHFLKLCQHFKLWEL